MTSTIKILLAEDDPLTTQMVVFKLKQSGFAVVTAVNGEAALTLAQAEKPELILLDVMMPILDGFEVLRRLKESPDLKNIPVIMLTVRNRETDVVTALDLGAADYMVKPFRPAELLARVRKHVRQDSGEDSPKA